MQFDDPKLKCAACEKKMDAARFFLCRECIEKLSPRSRQMVMNAPNGQQAVTARKEALAELGAKDTNDVRVPREKAAPLDECVCPKGTYLFEQRNFDGGIDKICDACGRIRKPAKEMVKR